MQAKRRLCEGCLGRGQRSRQRMQCATARLLLLLPRNLVRHARRRRPHGGPKRGSPLRAGCGAARCASWPRPAARPAGPWPRCTPAPLLASLQPGAALRRCRRSEGRGGQAARCQGAHARPAADRRGAPLLRRSPSQLLGRRPRIPARGKGGGRVAGGGRRLHCRACCRGTQMQRGQV
jgi:hypothetical protein